MAQDMGMHHNGSAQVLQEIVFHELASTKYEQVAVFQVDMALTCTRSIVSDIIREMRFSSKRNDDEDLKKDS